MNEFELIHHYFKQRYSDAAGSASGISLGIGDDAAVLQPTLGCQTVVAVDTLVSGVHFPENASAYDIGWRSLAVNLSDLAAMGAVPRWFTLALTIPSINKDWLQAFSAGLFGCAQDYNIKLVGGDTTAGPLTLSVQVVGEVADGNYLTRSGAREGDSVYLTGHIGDAMAGLGIMQNRYSAGGTQREYLLNRFMKPTPRIEAGLALSRLASAAIDISDGLVADLGHIAKASQLSAQLQLDKIPVSNPLIELLSRGTAQQLALSAGDDYEICFTVSSEKEQQLPGVFEKLQLNYSRIGEMKPGTGVSVLGENGTQVSDRSTGYQHFS
ncbi:MAG: thiamine-phosphate kinase [Pseudomonadales bacterium]|nr:thiamine-phosphate kinase [Pseudomonadales bacterium]